jgi:CoA:oxalate CoA-transferase
VLELSQFIAGPVCGCILADHGADVIKIERPGGEDARRIGPFVGGESLYYATYNRNKRAITIDLKTPEGRDLFRDLARETDVVLENFRPGVLDKMGLGYSRLSEINPRLIQVSISGFGQTGPWRELPAFDQIVQALSGIMYLGGEEGGGPEKLGISVSDYAAGLQGAIGTLLALNVRATSGVGQHVDVALFDSVIFMLETAVATLHSTGRRPARVGNGRPGSVPGNTYRCRDGWLYIAATSDRIWERLAAAMGPQTQQEFAALRANEARVLERRLVDQRINEWCADQDVAEVMAVLEKAEVPCAPVRNVDELLTDPHVAFRRSVEVMAHPKLGEHVVPGVPVKLSETPGRLSRRAAMLGEHTEEVLRQVLHLDTEDIGLLRERGAV